MNNRIDSALAASALRPFDRLPRRPWFFAPPLRVAVDTTAPALTLHTIQTCDAHEPLRCDAKAPSPAIPPEGTPTLPRRTTGCADRRPNGLPTAGEGTLWLWARTNFRDLIGNTRYVHGEVLLTARVPLDRVR